MNGKLLALLPVAIVALSVAASWGASAQKNSEQDRRIEQNEKAKEAIQELRERSSRVDERTKQIQRDIHEIKTFIRNIQAPSRPQPPQ